MCLRPAGRCSARPPNAPWREFSRQEAVRRPRSTDERSSLKAFFLSLSFDMVWARARHADHEKVRPKNQRSQETSGGKPMVKSVPSRVWPGQPWLFCLIAITSLLAAVFPLGSAWAQKQGGILRITHRDSPASMSIHEEGTISVVLPMMGVFNNLVMFDQHARQNSLDGIVPDLAESWKWSEDGKTLTFALRSGVTWHDGKPFTAADVKCTWDLLAGTAQENLKVNFRKGWYA